MSRKKRKTARRREQREASATRVTQDVTQTTERVVSHTPYLKLVEIGRSFPTQNTLERSTK